MTIGAGDRKRIDQQDLLPGLTPGAGGDRVIFTLEVEDKGGAYNGAELAVGARQNWPMDGAPSTGMSCLSLGEHRAGKPFEQVDRLIGHGGAEIEGNGGQGGVAALPFVSSEMLGRRPSSLPGELHKTALMHAMPARGVVADCPDMVQAFDEAEHRGRLCRLRHLPQPAEPALAGFRPALCQRAGGDRPRSVVARPRRARKRRPTQRRSRRRGGTTTGAAQGRQRRARREGGGGGQPVLQFSGMPAAVLLGGEIAVDRLRPHIDLFGDKGDQRRRRPLIGPQRPPRMTQVAQHQRITETAMIAAAAPDHREIRLRQHVMANQLTRLRKWIVQRGDLGLGQLLSAHRSCSPAAWRWQTSRSG